jgi:hypothetical protein
LFFVFVVVEIFHLFSVHQNEFGAISHELSLLDRARASRTITDSIQQLFVRSYQTFREHHRKNDAGLIA